METKRWSGRMTDDGNGAAGSTNEKPIDGKGQGRFVCPR